MKKILLSFVALTFVFASCTKSEVVDVVNNDQLIEFNPYTGKAPVTKATIADIATVAEKGFQVYAFAHNKNVAPSYEKAYMNKVVTGTTEDDTNYSWSYPGATYWPGTFELDFVAYSLNVGDLLTSNNESFVSYTYSVPDAVADQKDLLVATPVENRTNKVENEEGTTTNQNSVSMNFSHLLSRISFQLVTESATIPVTIEELKLQGNFSKTGTVDLTTVNATSQKPEIIGADAVDVTYDVLAGGQFTSRGSTTGSMIHNNSSKFSKYTGDAATFDDDFYSVSITHGEASYPVLAYQGVTSTEYVIKTTDTEYLSVTRTEEGEDTNKTISYTVGSAKEFGENIPAFEYVFDAELEDNQENAYMMIIPAGVQHNAKLWVKYFLPYAGTSNAAINDQGEYAAIDLSNLNFEAGKSYVFKLKVYTNAIGFTVTVEDWDTGEAGDIIDLN